MQGFRHVAELEAETRCGWSLPENTDVPFMLVISAAESGGPVGVRPYTTKPSERTRRGAPHEDHPSLVLAGTPLPSPSTQRLGNRRLSVWIADPMEKVLPNAQAPSEPRVDRGSWRLEARWRQGSSWC